VSEQGPQLVHFVPIITTVLTVPFALNVWARYRRYPERLHLLWWAIGIVTYGAGTLTESLTTVVGWREPIFRAWYITGALLGGAPLAQGTVYLLFPRRNAHRLTAALLSFITIAAVAALIAPIDYTRVESHRLTGHVFAVTWVRAFSPFINLYAVIFLIGGAVLSAIRYSRTPNTRHRVWANVLIAVGAILPGIGGAATRAGYTEVLYVTELAGLLLIWAGYRISVRPAEPSRASNGADNAAVVVNRT
jgi:hypothetical protein